MRVLWVVLAIVVWVALFAALTRYIGWATATITIEGDLSRARASFTMFGGGAQCSMPASWRRPSWGSGSALLC